MSCSIGLTSVSLLLQRIQSRVDHHQRSPIIPKQHHNSKLQTDQRHPAKWHESWKRHFTASLLKRVQRWRLMTLKRSWVYLQHIHTGTPVCLPPSSHHSIQHTVPKSMQLKQNINQTLMSLLLQYWIKSVFFVLVSLVLFCLFPRELILNAPTYRSLFSSIFVSLIQLSALSRSV